MCWKMGKEYFWDLREECPTSESSVSIMFSGATVIVNML